MMRVRVSFPLLALSTGVLSAQIASPRAAAEIDSVGVFPLDGIVAEQYSSGPGLRVGGEVRPLRFLALDAGWTAAWMATLYNCGRLGCEYSRLKNQLLDFGVRGVLPLMGGRVELSVGIGGGYIWFNPITEDNLYYGGWLFQYSGKAAYAVDRGGRWRLNLTIRTWRDLGRPVQQWLSTAAGVSYNLGRLR